MLSPIMSIIGSISSCDLLEAKIGQRQRCGTKSCPACGQELEGKPDWVGLPAGVKFDPTDQELIEHLYAKVNSGDLKSHPLIDEFIPTIEGEDGICYTHPEKLPGVTKDGLSKHYFHRPSKAYTTGTRKRRKVQSIEGRETRWHKTGKTRPVMSSGIQRGCKKILVLYTNFGKNKKPEKTNWVMHQYHLGQLEEEKEGELVVSKIFYQTQPRQCNWTGEKAAAVTASSRDLMRDNASVSSSSKEALNPTDELASAVGISGYSDDSFGLSPFGKNFHQMPLGEDGNSLYKSYKSLEQPSGSFIEQNDHASSGLHVMRPQDPLAGVLPPAPTDMQSGVLDSYVVSRMLYNNGNFQEASIPSCDEAEWLKYSYWPDAGNRDHHV